MSPTRGASVRCCVVETYVPAHLWLGVSADTDGDGGYDFNDYASSDGMVTEFSWALDHLQPGQTYYVIVAATDTTTTRRTPTARSRRCRSARSR